MKKNLLGVLFSAVMMFGAAGSAQAASIVFNGFCDGMTVNYDMVTGYASGMHTGTCLGGNVATVGSAGTVNGINAVTLSEPNVTYGSLIYIIRANGTWDLTGSDGLGGSVFLNSGTWTAGVPLLNGGSNTATFTGK